MKTIRRALLLLAVTLLLSMLSVFCASTDTFPAAELGLEPGNSSDYRRTTVWGAPGHFVVNMPNSERIGHIDSKDCFSVGGFFASDLLLFLLSWPLSYVIPIFFPIFVSFCSRVHQVKRLKFALRAAPRVTYFTA